MRIGDQAIHSGSAGKLHLSSRPAKMEIHSQPAKVQITNGPGVLEIDATASRASYGIYTVGEFNRRAAQQAKQQTLEAIGTIVAEGDRLMRIETGENAVAGIAADHNVELTPEITWSPVTRPDINYTPQAVSFQVQPQRLDIRVERGTLTNLTQPALPGSIDVLA